MSAVTDRLTPDDQATIARILAAVRRRMAAEQARLEREQEDEPRAGDGDHGAA